MSIFLFRNSILFWNVNTRCLTPNSFLFKEVNEILIYKFGSVVGSKNFDFCIILVFYKIIEILELIEDFTFIF
jgi:hypothetical protein